MSDVEPMSMGRTADRLLEAMDRRGVDQSALARELKVSQGTISKIVLGKTSNSRLLPRIATHLGVSLPWLLGVSDDAAVGDEIEPVDWQARELMQHFSHLALADRSAVLQLVRSLATCMGTQTHKAEQGAGPHGQSKEFRGE